MPLVYTFSYGKTARRVAQGAWDKRHSVMFNIQFVLYLFLTLGFGRGYASFSLCLQAMPVTLLFKIKLIKAGRASGNKFNLGRA
jgi:hypothetical protein